MALFCRLQKLSKMRKVSTEMVGDLDRAFLGRDGRREPDHGGWSDEGDAGE